MPASIDTTLLVASPNTAAHLSRLSRAFSEGLNSTVDGIVSQILLDLDHLCTLAREGKIHNVLSPEDVACITIPKSKPFPLDIAGVYYGFGLGNRWLNLGFLADAVERAFRARIMSEGGKLHPTDRTVIIAPHGVYMIDHTYTWFVYKRLE